MPAGRPHLIARPMLRVPPATGNDARCRTSAATWLALLAIVAGALPANRAAGAAPPAATRNSAPLELIVLGSGGPAALGRASSSYLLLLDGVPRILVDAGPGS